MFLSIPKSHSEFLGVCSGLAEVLLLGFDIELLDDWLLIF
jgi:hypothetical protein